MSAFYVTNRQDGFSISGSILTKSKFYGNSVSAIMDGVGRLTLLKRGEDYLITMPYAHCKGERFVHCKLLQFALHNYIAAHASKYLYLGVWNLTAMREYTDIVMHMY